MAILGPDRPMGVADIPAVGPIGQTQTVNQPFIWGQGGQRLTPQDIALQRQIAEQQRMAGADFSPVGSVWEGLGRVVNGLSGSYTRNQAMEAQEQNQAESQSIAELLMPKEGQAPSSASIIAAALNPYIDDNTRQLALMQYQQMNARSEASSPLGKIAADEGFIPGTPEFNQRVLELGNVDRAKHIPIEAGGSLLQVDPATGEVSYAVAPAGLAGQLNNQDPPPPVGSVETFNGVEYRFNGGDPGRQENWSPVMSDAGGGAVISNALSANTISQQEYDTVRRSFGPDGQAAFENWLRSQNIEVR